MKNSSMVLIGFLIFSTSVYSQSYPKIMQGLENQKVRIQEGINQGDLTKPEVARLVKGRKYIKSLIKKGTADKNFTVKERNQVLSILKKRSKNIATLRKNSARVGNPSVGNPKIEKALKDQKASIQAGIHRGDLTKPEVAILVKGRKYIESLIKKGLADKKFTAKERNQVLSILKKRSKNITMLLKNSTRVGNNAPSRTPVEAFLTKMNKNINAQNARIQKGQNLRKITKKEFEKLKRSLSKINEYIRLSLKDGKFSEKEKKRAHGLFLDRSSEIVRFSKN
jgi:DNA-binding MarR family transcriptional regulator